MSTVDEAVQTQLRNIEKRSGKSLEELRAIVQASGLTKFGDVREMLKRDLGMGHGDANAVTKHVLSGYGDTPSTAAPGTETGVLDGLYTGPKAALRPIHERVTAAIDGLGPYEVAPKKGYVSLRRKKQFAMVGPATNTRVEVGLNMKGVGGTDRLEAQAPGGMCQYKVKLTDPAQVDDELIGWLRAAYDAAG